MSLITPGEAAAPTARQDDSRKQLGAFLRARRESLDPQRLGLPRSGRRRTPGLRREEVAMLADVGVTWYTWLEQGREVNPSVAVMQAIAEALQCSELRLKLFDLGLNHFLLLFLFIRAAGTVRQLF